MRLALREARRGRGRTSPNPPVGAVVVTAGGTVAGRGFHRRAGAPHAEIEALASAGSAARGATLVVTLEPCAHHGRTPPCTEAIVAAGVRRVVIGARDPNPHVPGQGAALLAAAGVEVADGVLEAACNDLIAPFRKHVRTGLPWVTLKLAASLDGRIATAAGDSRWITGPDSRRYAHRLRNEHDAILVGAETVRRDDPALTCRLRGGRNPLRIVLDGRLRLPATARVLTDGAAPTLIVAGRSAPARRPWMDRAAGVQVMRLSDRDGVVSPRALLRALGRRGVVSVLVEGGARVAGTLLRAGAVDRLLCFLAPMLIGEDGRPMVGPLGVLGLRSALRLGPLRLRRFATDILVATDVRAGEPGESD